MGRERAGLMLMDAIRLSHAVADVAASTSWQIVSKEAK